AFDLLHFIGGEIRAIRIEAVGQSMHRAFHHLVDVDVLDVMTRYEADDIVEHLEVLVGVFASDDFTEQTADDCKCNHWRGNRHDDQSSTRTHIVSSPQVPKSLSPLVPSH